MGRKLPTVFIPAVVVTLIALVLAWFYGGIIGVATTLLLAVVEVTFSFDNAIVNAKTLTRMSPTWQRMFMTLGVIIAVFGMRVLFPLIIVMVTTGLSMPAVIRLALFEPNQYAAAVQSAGPSIAAFGGLFLLTLALSFFLDKGREIRWLEHVERPLQRIGYKGSPIILSLVVLFLISLVPVNHPTNGIILASIAGIATYVLVNGGISVLSGSMAHSHKTNKAALASGLALFLYLEVLDASFSFDGVIGAFAITHDIVLIAIGLGIGAFWVRSLTLFIVHKKVLATYRYLEHAAHYVIGMLAVSLIVGMFVQLPETLVGVIGVGVIGISVLSSIKANRRDLVDTTRPASRL